MSRGAVFSGLALILLLPAGIRAQNVEEIFHRAYYLEKEENDLEGAVALYERVINVPGAAGEWVRQARTRAASCREQLRSRDLSRLMPPEVLAYVELRNPGLHLERLLDMCGILSSDGEAGPPVLPVVISPRLVEGLKDLRGMACAVTRVEPRHGIPEGVAVLHPGDNHLLFGLLETLLSAAALEGELSPSTPIEGHTTYAGPFGVIVLTDHLIIAGNPPALVADAVRRLHQDRQPSLMDSQSFAALKKRRADALVFAYADARALVAMARQEMAREGRIPEEYRIADVIGDIESVRSGALALRTDGEVIAADFWLQLDEGHRSLAYNLLRTPIMQERALRSVPSGAVGFLGFALSSGDAGGPAGAPERSEATPYLTGLDIGREIFSNVNEVVVFFLPPAGNGGTSGVPDAGAILTVKDPSKSRLLWTELLRIPATAVRGAPEPVRTEVHAGVEVHIYSFPERIHVHVAALEDRILLATTRRAITGAIEAARGRRSILDDSEFTPTLEKLSRRNKVLILHAGRASQILLPMARVRGQEAELVTRLFEKTVATVSTSETATQFHAHVSISGLNLAGVVRQVLEQHTGRHRHRMGGVGRRAESRSARPRPTDTQDVPALPSLESGR